MARKKTNFLLSEKTRIIIEEDIDKNSSIQISQGDSEAAGFCLCQVRGCLRSLSCERKITEDTGGISDAAVRKYGFCYN